MQLAAGRFRARISRTCPAPPPWVLGLMLCTACSSGTRHPSRGALDEPSAAGKQAPITEVADAAANSGAHSGNAEQPLLPIARDPDPQASVLLGEHCAKQDRAITRVVPTIWLVVDGSGSMNEALSQSDATPRWDALRSALLEPSTGIVSQLQHQVNWGMVMYDGPLPDIARDPNGGTASSCPRVVVVEPKLENFGNIDSAYPMTPLGGSTPTDKALTSVSAQLPDAAAIMDQQSAPSIVVLATDGAPNDFCAQSLFPSDVKPRVIEAVKQLHAAGTQVYVISLAGQDPMLTEHLAQVAAEGGTGKAPFVVQNKDELLQTFREILGPTLSCKVELAGEVEVSRACQGKVNLNGIELACNAANGYRVESPHMLELLGRACETYKQDALALLHAEFPCPGID
jgi:hypothetical protein